MGAAAPSEGHVLREYGLVSAVFVVTRVLLRVAGLRFNPELDWMFLADAAHLRDRLLETLYYFHAFPPGLNLLAGILLKIGGPEFETVADVAFTAFGLVLVNSLLYLGRALRLARPIRIGVCVGFLLAPPSIYFGHLFLYTYPTAASLALAGALFHRAALRPSVAAWLPFFLVCAGIGWLRSTFHWLWFAAMIALSLAAVRRAARRSVLIAAIGPAALLLVPYVKNAAVFGFFGITSQSATPLYHVTVLRMPAELRRSWVEQGKLSPFAGISVYASPRAYGRWFPERETSWPAQLTDFERPSVNAPNYNHWYLLEAAERRRADAWVYLRERPFEYAGTVLQGLKQFFQPSTRWHPHDREPGSPHHEHRQVLGRYEAFYEVIVHGFPFSPVGLYVTLPLSLWWVLREGRRRARMEDPSERAVAATLRFCVAQIVFVIVVTSVAAHGENARYRFAIEPLIWLVTAFAIVNYAARGRRAGRRVSRAATAGSTLGMVA